MTSVRRTAGFTRLGIKKDLDLLK